MVFLIAGLLIFLGMHSFSIVAPDSRDRIAERLGLLWKAGFSIVAAFGLALIVYGYGQARLSPVVLYTPPPVLRYVTLVLMLIALLLLLAAYIPGRIATAAGHPLVAAVKAWALSHLLVNGALADVLLFGGFLAWAVAERISLKRRKPRSVPTLPASPFNDITVVV
ncbi:MAG TPA: NnrU family protein, partial [Gammaproteobacteria bacterium]|nr:NnrU family protein [Gammaproteobacteria bacterium]